MELAKAQKYTARVSEKYYLTDSEKFLLIKLELVEPDRMNFLAGQYVSIRINERGERRSYSMVSTPDVEHGLTLVAEMIEGGKGTEYLKSIPVGTEVELLGPLGRFVVESDNKLLFVATGAGITPIKSMIDDLLINKRETRPIRLHWGMREERDMFWFDNFQRLTDEYSNFVFDQVLSRPGDGWELCKGHVQDCLSRDFTNGELYEWSAYICGSPKTVESIETKLIELGMVKEEIHHEKFS